MFLKIFYVLQISKREDPYLLSRIMINIVGRKRIVK